MTGLEIFLILFGVVSVVVSFLVGERVDGKKDKAQNELNTEKLMEEVKEQVNAAVESSIDDTVEKTAQELDKLSNEKIMAVSDYSENVLSEINKSHEEVVFLYSMLNDKEKEIKNTVKDVEMVKASVKKIAVKQEKEKGKDYTTKEEKVPAVQEEKESQLRNEYTRDVEDRQDNNAVVGNNNERILQMYKEGKSNIDIARELNLGMGEVRLVIDLYKTRRK